MRPRPLCVYSLREVFQAEAMRSCNNQFPLFFKVGTARVLHYSALILTTGKSENDGAGGEI